MAIRHGLDCISEEILIEQINIIKYGSKLEKGHIRNLEEDLRQTAFHEAGHAVLSYLLLPNIKIEQVTIAPRLGVLGFISYSFEDFPSNLSKDEVFNNICVLMAGRMASMKKFGLKGMDEELGFVHADTLSHNVTPQAHSRSSPSASASDHAAVCSVQGPYLSIQRISSGVPHM